MKINTKDRRTLNALTNLMGVSISDIQGDLPALGGTGSVMAHVEDWVNDGEGRGIVETLVIDFDRKESGRLGRWSLESLDEEFRSFVTEGSGQW